MSEYKFPVEAGHIMMFARGVGDTNRIYFDEEYANNSEPGGIIAPPTFPRACSQFDPDYYLRPKPGEPWFGSAKEATGPPPHARGRCAHRHVPPRRDLGEGGQTLWQTAL